MRRDLEHRLQALETRWFGSPRIAAYHRAFRADFEEAMIKAMPEELIGTMSDDELIRAIEAAVSDKDSIGPGIWHLSDAELERAMKDSDRALRAHIPFDGAK